MRRATTPTHSFTIPINPSNISSLLITYEQNHEIVLEKTKDDLKQNGNVWSFTLTQEEANLFSTGKVSVQVRVVTPDENALASDIYEFDVWRVLNDEVLP